MRYWVLPAVLALAGLNCAHVVERPVGTAKDGGATRDASEEKSGKNRVGHRFADQTDKSGEEIGQKSCTASKSKPVECPETAKVADQAAKQGDKGCNASDVKMGINKDNHRFPDQMDNCASSSWGNTEESATCLRKDYPGLSEPCIMCFAQMAHCSAQNCKTACIMTHMSDGCLRCAESNCRDLKAGSSFSLETCTGLTAVELPPHRT